MSPDDGARRAIAERLGDTMLVEAGAGTGKTRALVDRVVGLVVAGTPIERIAAITFTERAASELRDRVRAGLEQALLAATDLITAGRCQSALGGLDGARLSTIHAFAQSLLGAFAAEAGVDPELTVLDELAAGLRFEERWRAALEGLDADDDAGRAIDRAMGLGMSVTWLATLARRLQERGDIAADIAADPPTAERADWSGLEHLRAGIAAVPTGRVTGDDNCLARMGELAATLDTLIALEGFDRDAALVGSTSLHNLKCGRLGNRANWGGDAAALEAGREAVRAASAQLAVLLAAERSSALADLVPHVAALVLDEGAARRREGALLFDDLILWTRDLLVGSASARAALRERFDALLIDEFQDTDPWQADIAAAFARDDAGGLDPGRLFMVGDPKQSIYRFRRADMAVYAAQRSAVAEAGGLLPTLRVNRRSRRVILDWVNEVFARLIGEGEDPSLQPAYVPVEAERDDALEGPGVAWIGGPMPAPARAWDLRMAEAADVAANCRAAVQEGWEVQERDGSVRRARLGDVAVLIPARTGLSALESALRRAGLPYRVEGGSLVYRTQELRDLINCLAAIDDPSDEVAVVGALRSPGFACSDLELAEHRRAGMRFNYLAPGLEGPGPVAEGLRCLRAHHHARHDRSLAASVERLVADLGAVEIGIVNTRGRDPYRRARFVVEQARAFEADGPRSMRAFVAWLEERTTSPVLGHDGAGLDDDEDAVRVLTVHAAKGLEFPIVVLAGIGTRPPTSTVPVLSRGAGGLAVAVGSKARGRFELGDVEAAEILERENAQAEAARVLYVAATRARDHLIVSLHHLERWGGGSGAVRLMEAGAHERAVHRPPPPAAGPTAAHGALAGLVVEPAGTRDEHRAAREALVTRATRVRYTSATAIAAAERGSESDEPWSRGRGGSRVGRAVHAALQSLPLDAGPDAVAAVCSAQAVAEAVPSRAAEVRELVAAALGSQAAARARAAAGALREVPFAMTAEGSIVEGFIDLVVPAGDALEIVDWKTDDVDAAGVPGRLAGYRMQAGLYSAGLARATGRPVERVTYVFLRAGVEVSPGDPAALAEAALRALADA